jgi:hypothetical protein
MTSSHVTLPTYFARTDQAQVSKFINVRQTI